MDPRSLCFVRVNLLGEIVRDLPGELLYELLADLRVLEDRPA